MKQLIFRLENSRCNYRSFAVLIFVRTSPRAAETFGIREDTVRLWRSDFVRGGAAALLSLNPPLHVSAKPKASATLPSAPRLQAKIYQPCCSLHSGFVSLLARPAADRIPGSFYRSCRARLFKNLRLTRSRPPNARSCSRAAIIRPASILAQTGGRHSSEHQPPLPPRRVEPERTDAIDPGCDRGRRSPAPRHDHAIGRTAAASVAPALVIR